VIAFGAARRGRCWLSIVLVLAAGAWGHASGDAPDQIIANLRSAYARVSDYQVLVESTMSSGEALGEETRLFFRYRRPGSIRVDFLHPREGWVLVYPSGAGKVRVRPAGLLGFLNFSLDSDSPFLTVWPGQQLTQTDLGLLVENIAKSLTVGRLAPAEVFRTGGDLLLRVEAENHFRKGVATRYEFRIDPVRWLPVEVTEEVPQEKRRRRIRFRDLRVNVGLADALFRLE